MCISTLTRVTRQLLAFVIALSCVAAFDSCRPQLPKHVIGEGKMERILYDYHMAQSIADNTPPDSGTMETYRYELQQAVFRKHGITAEEFEQSMNFYCSDLQRLHKIYRNLERRFEREATAFGQTNVRDVFANLNADGDTANVWGGHPLIIVRSDIRENVQTWQQQCDSTWQAGDEIMWRFRPLNLSQRSMRTIVADLVVYYTNDSVRSTFRQVMSNGEIDVRVANPEGWTPAAVAGHLYMPSTTEPMDLTTVAVTEIMLVRFHKAIAHLAVADSLTADSVAVDSLAADSVMVGPQLEPDDRRLSPDEFRRQQPVDQKIDIVKEKPYTKPSRQQGRRRLQQPHLLQRR